MTRRTSSAVTMPSPDVGVLEHDDVAGLLAAEHRARHLHALEDVLVADRRATTSPPAASTARCEPAVRQHDTTRPPGSAPRASRSSARIPSTWSPSTISPVAVDRDEPVGVAVERETDVRAALATTSRASEAGAVAPQSTLMLTPSGSTWIAVDRAPVAARISAADRAAGSVRAVEHDAQARRRRSSREP